MKPCKDQTFECPVQCDPREWNPSREHYCIRSKKAIPMVSSKWFKSCLWSIHIFNLSLTDFEYAKFSNTKFNRALQVHIRTCAHCTASMISFPTSVNDQINHLGSFLFGSWPWQLKRCASDNGSYQNRCVVYTHVWVVNLKLAAPSCCKTTNAWQQ